MKGVLTISLLFFCLSANSQGKYWGVQTGVTVARSGLLWQTGAQRVWAKHQVTIGGQLALSQSYQPSKQISGPYVNWKYHVFSFEQVTSFIGVNVQTLFYKGVAYDENPRLLQSVSEIALIQGLEYQINKHFVIGEWLGIGRFAERYINPKTAKIAVVDGQDFSGKIYFGFRF